MDTEQFGRRLAELREQAKLSQPDLAKKSGLSIRTISRLENGVNEVSFANALSLADALEVSVEAFRKKPRRIEKKSVGRPKER
jgi:transcriptional regulator with XRE-family HTH domain